MPALTGTDTARNSIASHSHWAKTAHKEALIENRRGEVWSKLAKAIVVAAKMGGGDPAMNCACYAIGQCG